MALAVAETITGGGALVVEAGTGVGKTFAYLVPALLSGERVLISTATKALQDQLYARDLPRLVQALQIPVRTALLKGRSSYLCVHRLHQARHEMGGLGLHLDHVLSRVELWAQGTRTGDLAELPGLDERSPALPFITSTRDNCLGASCPRFAQCHVQLARREALAADVVVINHHLFFADLAVRESGMAELLPTVRVVIFDEAHQLNSTGVQFLGVQLGTGQVLDYARDLLAAGTTWARGMRNWPALAGAIDSAARDLRMAAGPTGGGARRAWADRAPDGVEAVEWAAAMAALVAAFQSTLAALDEVSGAAADLAWLHERAVRMLERLAIFSGDSPPDSVRWLDVGAQLRMVESPLDIAPRLQSLWQAAPAAESAWDDDTAPAPAPAPAQAQAGGRAWIFTSATLGDDAALSWFTDPCGLQSARVLRVPSPFDYARQAALYVPAHLPRPADPAHPAQVARFTGDAVARLGGRTLVLTTTLRSLHAIGDALQARFPPGSRIDVLVQGQGSKREMVDRFRSAGQPGDGTEEGLPQRGCVLVASASFWEGIDVPGEALQLVVIDKLPFPPPGDPVVDARTHRLELQGRSAFKDFALPEAAVALKQGAGRLIRSESDTGLLVIADTRLTTMGYGKRLLRALPPMRLLDGQAEWECALDGLRAREGDGGTDGFGADKDAMAVVEVSGTLGTAGEEMRVADGIKGPE